MKLTPLLITTIFILASCKPQPAIPTVVSTTLPGETPAATATPVPTETPLPTETASPVPTPSDVFGAIPLNSVQAFSLEPIVQAIFDQTLQGYITSGTIQEYRVDGISVFPSSDGTLIAEIMYSLRAEYDPFPDDFGTPSADHWITSKCSRFDLVATETEHQLKNKRLCS
jgi:hypothetical protein